MKERLERKWGCEEEKRRTRGKKEVKEIKRKRER